LSSFNLFKINNSLHSEIKDQDKNQDNTDKNN